MFSSPCSSILLCMLCCTLAEYQPRFQKRIDISCGIYGIAYCYFLEKKASTKLLSRQGYLHASACCLRSRENEEMEIFVKSGQNKKLIFFISIYLDSVVSLISIHLQKFETNQEFCILFFTQLYSCFLLFSSLKACNSSACGGRRWSLEIKNRIMGWNLKVYA